MRIYIDRDETSQLGQLRYVVSARGKEVFRRSVTGKIAAIRTARSLAVRGNVEQIFVLGQLVDASEDAMTNAMEKGKYEY
jgi:hypothetical protein